ncbi:MAG: hypothetical protein EXR83_01355 [Gammaproteobacteria bacterium]|nr:hypothetical protein [Gammaproteobacteria bacterium]
MTPSQPAPSLQRNRGTLLLIAGLFALPILVAWLLASGLLGLGERGQLNHGVFIKPALDIAQLPLAPTSQVLRELPPADWAMLYISAGSCEDLCGRTLHELATIRSVIGNEAPRLSVFGLLASPGVAPAVHAPLPRLLVDPATVAAIDAALRAPGTGIALPRIVVLDWRGQLMMSFAPDSPPADIKEDLKRLLKASAIR